ncbi:MAG: adenylate/guanylate cyclase domain-containing protein, partial [Roseiarcus sp.]
MEAEHVERRLAAILAADVAAYSRLMGTDEEGTLARLKAHRRELVDPKIAEHRGRIVKTTGDGLLVEFQSVVDAVRCAVEWQRGMAERNAGVPAEGRIDFRIGINVGDIIIDGGDIFGDGVNIAARLEGLAEPGGICVSRVVRDQVRDKLAFGFKNMGEQTVKNIARPVPVHRVILDGESGDEGGDDDVEPKPGPIGRGAKSLPLSRWLLATLGLLIVVAAIASLAWWRAQTGRSAGNGPRVAAGGWAAAAADASLVVLDFANGTGDRDQDYLNAGFTEDLVSALAHFQGVRVVNRNPSSTPGDASSIARRLGTRYVLTGRYRRDGNQIDVDTQMIDAKNGSVLWDEHETRETRDVSTVEDTVLKRVIGTLG